MGRPIPKILVCMAALWVFTGVAWGQSGITKTLREAAIGQHVDGYYNKADSAYSEGGLRVQLAGLTADASHKVEFSKNNGDTWSAANQLRFKGAYVSNAIISTNPAENAVDVDIWHSYLTATPYSMSNGETIQIRVINDVFAAKDTFVCTVTGGGNDLIYDITAPTILSVSSSTGDGTYGIDSNINVTVTFSEPTTLSDGNLQVTLNTSYTVNIPAGTYSNTASGTYTVQEGNLTGDLTNTNITDTGLSLADPAGNVVPSYTPGSNLGTTSAIVVDGVRPTITSVTSSSSASPPPYGIGANVNITVTFSEATTVADGNLRVALDVGRNVDIIGATYSNDAIGTYTVVEGDASDDLTTTGISITAGTIEDGAGNALEVFTPASNLGITSALVIDGVRPTITSVNSSSASTTYGIGNNIGITVYFSELVTLSSGNLLVELETGATDRQAIITPFTNASSGTGTYTVQEGDESPDLTENSVSKVGGTLRDAAGNDLTNYAVPGDENLNDNKAIVIDGVRPTISIVTSLSPDDNYKIGDNILVQVTFSEEVSLSGGNLEVTLETGDTDRKAIISSVSNSTTAVGTYTVQNGDESADLTANVVGLSAGTLYDVGGNNVTDFTIPGGQNIADLKAIVVDGVRPTIDYITSTTVDETYNIGDAVNVRLFFTEAVTTADGGSIVVTLETGDTDRQVIISGVISSSSANGSYTVQDGDESTDLNVNTVAMSAGSLMDDFDNAVTDFSIPGGSNLADAKALVIDGIRPTVTNVSATTLNWAYKAEDNIYITVQFSEVVDVLGSPTLNLDVGGGYLVSDPAGTGTNTLTFTYTVQATHNSGDLDYVDANSLLTGGGSIRDAAGNDATLTLYDPGTGVPGAGSLGANKAIIIDTEEPTVLNVTSTKTDGYYKAGVTIPIAVVLSEAVSVGGTPQLTLALGAGYAVDYANRTSGDTLFFDYTVQAGHTSSDLAYISTGALGVSGTIEDHAGNPANRTLATPGDANSLSGSKELVIDTTEPTVSSVSSTAPDGYYVKDDVIPITVTFSEVVNVAGTGTPTLTLETGDTDKQVSYVSGSGTTDLLFNYTVGSGHESDNLDYTSIDALQLNVATIKDSADNDADPTLVAPGANGSLGYLKDRNIDAIIPSVTAVTSTIADGAYKAEVVIPIAVVFSENVGVLGTPTLTLDVGGGYDVDYANRTSGDTLFFDYTVLPGHNKTDLGYTSTTALKLNGGSIQDAATNLADTVLQTPTDPASLSGAKNLDIDTTPPVFSSVAPADSSYRNTTTVSYTLSEDLASGTITWSYTGGVADPAPHIQTLTGTELATGVHADITLTNDPDLVSGTVYSITFAGQDAAGNAATNIVRTDVIFDNTLPQAALTYSDTLASQGDTVNITATFNEAATSKPRISIAYAVNTVPATDMDSTSTTVWTYDAIVPGGNDGLATITITATDLAGNALTAGNTTNRTRLLVDNTPPGYVLSYSPDSLVKAGDMVTITATIEESVQPTPTISITFKGSGPNITDALMSMAAFDSIWTYVVTTPTGNDGFATVTITALDLAGNAVTHISGSNTLKVDNTPPTITPSSPVDDGFVRTTAVTYTLGETIASGQVIWTWEENAGVMDTETPHPQALVGSELNSPGYSGLLTNAPTLVQAAAYTIEFIAVDYAGNADTAALATVTYDTLAPDTTGVVVSDGPAADIDSTSSTDSLAAHWTSFSDPVSGIALYEYAIGTTQDSSDVVDWTSNGTDTLVTVRWLQLVHNRWYYFSVRAKDGAGNVSDSVVSDGVIIVDKPRLTVNIVQNSVISEYVQIFVNDTLAMADSIRIIMDSLRVSVTEIDTFAYVGTHKLAGSGPHSLEVTGFSGWGDTTRTSSLAMTLAKQGQPWVAVSVDQRFKTSGFPGSVSGDRYLLVVDSTLMGLSAVRGGAYRLGDGQFSFNQPVRVSMRPGMNKNGREDAQAIYILRSNGRWEELPSVDEGELVTTWANSTGTFRLGRRTIIIPQTTSLHQNYPNPFNPSTRIVFDLGFQEGPQQQASVIIYNLLGQEVRTLFDGLTPAGRYELVWRGIDKRGASVASGVYFVRLLTGSGQVATKKMLLVR